MTITRAVLHGVAAGNRVGAQPTWAFDRRQPQILVFSGNQACPCSTHVRYDWSTRVIQQSSMTACWKYPQPAAHHPPGWPSVGGGA
jgi:hypothetical protein